MTGLTDRLVENAVRLKLEADRTSKLISTDNLINRDVDSDRRAQFARDVANLSARVDALFGEER